MGRKITDGQAVDVTAPAGTIEFGEMYRIDGWSGFAMDAIASSATDRGLALEVSLSLWRIKTPAGTAGTRGAFLQWATGAGFKTGGTDLQDLAAPAAGGTPQNAVAKVEGVRNSAGYATVRLCDGG